jgi:hypothetical protein
MDPRVELCGVRHHRGIDRGPKDPDAIQREGISFLQFTNQDDPQSVEDRPHERSADSRFIRDPIGQGISVQELRPEHPGDMAGLARGRVSSRYQSVSNRHCRILLRNGMAHSCPRQGPDRPTLKPPRDLKPGTDPGSGDMENRIEWNRLKIDGLMD